MSASLAGEPAAGLEVDMEVWRDDFRLRVAVESAAGVLVLFGPSGAGKSTILQAIAGLVTPRTGEIRVGGRTLFRRGLDAPDVDVPARLRRTGYVFQDYALFPHLCALDNVAYPLRRGKHARSRALEELRRVGMEQMAERFPHELSGGQQQRVAIARALAAGPHILLLDEPFGALDLEIRRRMRGEIRRLLTGAGLPVVLVTHDREEALALGDRVVVIDEGSVAAAGDPLTVLGHPSRERVARLVGVENVLRLTVRARLPEEGVTRCGRGEFALDAPLSEIRSGAEVALGIRADDVLLAAGRPDRISARNTIPGVVTSVRPEGAVFAVELDCHGVPLVSHVTRSALDELEIRPGAEVWAVIKTASCAVLGR